MAENENVNVNATTEQTATTETVQNADLNAEIARLRDENARLKSATDKACGEAANYKKALREKQSEAEKAEADRAERDASIQAELEAYRTKERVHNYQTKLIDCGYDLETASKMAGGLPEGVSDEFFATQKQFVANQKKAIESDLLGKQPGLSTGNTPSAEDISKAEDAKMRSFFGLK